MSRVAEPITATGRLGREINALTRTRLTELAFAFGIVLALRIFAGLLVDGAGMVGLTLLVWLGIYLSSCLVFPLRTCGRCDGAGKPRTGDGWGNWRDKVCPRCDGTKERRRWGAVLLSRGGPDRHDRD